MNSYKDLLVENKKPFYLSKDQITWVNNTFLKMSDDEKIEQLFSPLMYSSNTDYVKYMATKYSFGGVMFRNDETESNYTAIRELQKLAKIPLLISANLEDGGSGISNEGTYIGRQMLISATNNVERAYQLGKVSGKEGNAMGVNWTFSPVVDIDKNFRNPITNVRTYGDSPDQVYNMSRKYIEGLQGEGVTATIKHFPGDGVDELDQHLATSVNSLTLDEWEASYGEVYRQLIEDGIKTVMVGHIAMPAIESYYSNEFTELIPATLSKNILTYLKQELDFDGLIVTDATPMVGFMSAMDRETAVPLAIENGCDVFLFNQDLDEDIFFMKQGYKNGILSEKRLNEAVIKILSLKASMNLHQSSNNSMPLEDVKSILRNEEHSKWAQEIADEGITLVKDTQQLLPIDPVKHKRVLLQILGDFDSNDRVYSEFEQALTNEGFIVTKYIPEKIENIFDDTKVNDFKDRYDLVIYIGNIENASNKTVARINWHTIFGAGNNLPWFIKEVPTLFISVGNPYHLLDIPTMPTFINGYCHTNEVISSTIEKILGKSEFKGMSPIDPFLNRIDTKF